MRSRIHVQCVSRLPGIPSEAQIRRWANAALGDANAAADVTIRIVNAAEGRRLNADFRDKPYATNVLTFVYHEPNASRLSGDIVLCAPVLAREAREQGKSRPDHYAHMVIHGLLHLAGMDHLKPRDAHRMEAVERRVLASLGVGDPYAA